MISFREERLEDWSRSKRALGNLVEPNSEEIVSHAGSTGRKEAVGQPGYGDLAVTAGTGPHEASKRGRTDNRGNSSLCKKKGQQAGILKWWQSPEQLERTRKQIGCYQLELLRESIWLVQRGPILPWTIADLVLMFVKISKKSEFFKMWNFLID